MAFMIPEYTREPFVIAEIGYDTHVVPEDVWFDIEKELTDKEKEGLEIEVVTGKWFVRLSAPGYLDATDWSGPFDTLNEAKTEIEEMYEVDPDTGEELF